MSSLKGKKILVTIQELENKEHRGIASYTKSLIKALNNSEAEIWLLVSMDFKNLKFKNYNENFQNSLLSTFISDYLKKGVDNKYSSKLKSKNPILSKIIFFYENRGRPLGPHEARVRHAVCKNRPCALIRTSS